MSDKASCRRHNGPLERHNRLVDNVQNTRAIQFAGDSVCMPLMDDPAISIQILRWFISYAEIFETLVARDRLKKHPPFSAKSRTRLRIHN